MGLSDSGIDSGNWSEDYDRLAKVAIERLSVEGQPYVIDKAFRETEGCVRCRKELTGGYLTIVYPRLQGEMDIPFMALHFMRDHDSTSYKGTDHSGELDTELLERSWIPKRIE